VIYCTNCGHAEPEDARFCAACGTSLAEPAEEPASVAPPAPPRPLSTPPSSPRTEPRKRSRPALPSPRQRLRSTRASLAHRLRRLLTAAIALTALAALLGAAFLGWKIHDWLGSKGPTRVSVTVNRPIRVVSELTTRAGTMPDILGLDSATARQVLVDAGIDPATVSTTTKPYAGDTGTVIDQQPAPGTGAAGQKIVLTLSAPALMPPLTGTPLTDARTAVSDLGASVLVKTLFRPGTTENTVLQTDPAAGKPIVDRVTLVVAEAPSAVFLTKLRSISSDCNTETLNAGGVSYQDALVCEPGDSSSAAMEFLLNRHVSAFAAILGLGDRGGTDTPVTFSVFVDGKLARRLTLRFGAKQSVNVPVVDALRIRIETSAGKYGPSGTSPQAVLANARFLGGRSAIDNLVQESTQ
jgi:hypothetical protein